jgi:hypothetical protein
LATDGDGIPPPNSAGRGNFISKVIETVIAQHGEALLAISPSGDDLTGPDACASLIFKEGVRGEAALRHLLKHPNLAMEMEGRMLMVPLQRIIKLGVISGMRLLLICHEHSGSFALQGVSKCILTECGVEDAVVLGEFLGVTGKRTIGMAKGLPDGRKIIAIKIY